MSMITELFGQIPNDIETQMLIAPVLSEMIATQAFAINDQFIVDNVLYKATKAIAVGDTISVGTDTTDNCVLSDNITQQIEEIQKWKDVSSEFTISSGITCTLMYAFEKDGLVIFSLVITVNISVGNQIIPLYVNNSIKPKNSTALSIASGSAGSSINDITAFLIADGRLVIRSAGAVSGKSVFISGCYLIDSV